MKITPKKNPSIGFSGLLTLLFIGLKLTNHINWSWWWVLSPIAIQLTIVVLLIALVAILEKKWK